MEVTKIETNYKRNLFWDISCPVPKDFSLKHEMRVLNVYDDVRYQTFLGFGGACTESAGFAFSKLPDDKKNQMLNDLYSVNGLNYSIVRLPIASSDFSKRPYAYTKKKDLSDFSLKEDEDFVLPLLRRIKETKSDLTLFSAPWSPPSFMKSNKLLILGGKLEKEFYSTYADYLVKYINSYKENGFEINYISVQNEPNARQVWESCLYTPEEEADFAINYLGPKFKENNIETKILIWDHNKERLYSRAKAEFNIEGSDVIAGMAYHYYSGDHFDNIRIVREKFPNKLLIHTEGCTGYSHFRPEDEVQNGELYGHDILGDLNNGANAYIDWNLILDNKGGPNHKFNYCNSPLMLNKENNDYIKNLTYYYIGQFSKYILPGSVRLGSSSYSNWIEITAFENPDGTIVIVLLNKNNWNMEYDLCIGDKVLHDNLDAHAIVTYKIYK